MASTANFDLTYNKLDVVAGGALSNATSTPVSGGSGGSGVTQIVAGTNVTISPSGGTGVVTVNSTAGGGGTVTSVASGTGLTGGPITTSGTLSIASTGVSAASYGTASSVPTIAVNAQGQITSASNTSIAISGGAVSGNIAGNAANVTGTVAIGNGGTGATTAATARTNLGLGTVATQTAPSGTSSQLLANNGSGGFNNVTVGTGLSYSGGTLTSSSSGGTVTSVGTAGSVNGITLTGGPITTSGTVTLGGTLGSIANSQLSNSAITINTSTGLSGGGTVSLGGSLTLTNTVSGLPSGATQGQVLLQGASTSGWYNQSYNVTAFASLSAAITAAGSTGVLYFPTAYTIPSGTTISLPVIVEGLLTCSGTATFNGTIQAPLTQIFSGGTVSIGPNTPYIYPEWFGAAKTGSSDDQPAISAALSAVTLASGSSAPNQFVVLTSTYYLGSVLTLTNSQMFKVVGGASFYPYSTYTGDCIVYQYNSNNTLTDIPTIVGFTTGAGLTLFGCKVLKATGFMIKSCKYGIKIKAGASGHEVLDNYVNVHFIPDCQYGVFFTDDGSSATIQGNEIYSNFYTNDNIHTNPWVTDTISKTVDNAVIGLWSVITNLGTTSQTNWNILANTTGITYSVGSSFLAAVAVSTSGSTGTVTQYYATNIAACYWDNLNVYNWNGNTVQIKAIDINGATNSYGFYNASNFSTYGGYSFLNGWQLGCPLWFGGINSHNLSSAYYMAGYFLDSEFRYAIQTPSSNAPYNLINIQGSSNRFIFARGGGNWNYNTTNSLPQTYYQAQDTANSRSSFSTASVAYCAPFTNRIYCTYTISSTIAPGAELTLYVYTPITDAYIQSSIFGASNNFTVQPLANNGLLPEVVYDNSLTNANEVVVKFRNVSGANISSGTFNFMVTVGL